MNERLRVSRSAALKDQRPIAPVAFGARPWAPAIGAVVAVIISGALHLALYRLLDSAPPNQGRVERRMLAEIEITKPERPAAPAPRRPPPEAEPIAPKAKPERAVPKVESDPPESSERSETSAPVSLTGTMLTNAAAGAAWSSAIGDGSALASRLRAPSSGAGRAANSSSTPSTAAATGSGRVAVAKLSQRPAPPSLDTRLLANYPREARLRGKGGVARVRARIDPDGTARNVRVLQQSDPEFGAACQRTLNGSRWSPPLDLTGHAAATEINYTCRFQVAR